MSPALANAFRLLRFDLYGYLDEIEFLVNDLDDADSPELRLIGELVPGLVTTIRGMLARHVPNKEGFCPVCSIIPGGRQFRRESWPCREVQTIHDLLKDPDGVFAKVMAASSSP
ncbi:hypothetical protein F0L68_26205 [Solihabitans fulvus]|uniref:Uncharacterized protein n=1 Tax=Solihabitans fulvus TaxID=1892852 RepID=A0A5B2WY75_9PSEU|nr:hypothetical protein [Solihabitans fulvus]KAA2256531.1 hypothetical protein F0L68_26205 [Solihabitans fulvus]